jgi:hypothetical protein
VEILLQDHFLGRNSFTGVYGNQDAINFDETEIEQNRIK